MTAAAPPPAAPKWGDLGVRALSAAVLIPAVLLDVWLGGVWFTLFAGLLGVLMAFEFTAIAHGGHSGQFAIHASAALAGAFLPGEVGAASTLAAIASLTALSYVVTLAQSGPRTFWTYVGVPYVALPAIALVMLRAHDSWGAYAIIWVMVVTWAADTLAYFAGRIIGGPKLAPRISPKKTWAGLGGAMTGAAIASTIAAFSFAPGSIVPLAILAAVLAVFEQAGDLFESSMKRHFGVKDSGRLIPGHGGVIDRVDGLVTVAVIAAFVGYLREPLSVSQGLLLW
jgi:phosphatidate cytidylyltransferase